MFLYCVACVSARASQVSMSSCTTYLHSFYVEPNGCAGGVSASHAEVSGETSHAHWG